MKLLIDENLPGILGEGLCEARHVTDFSAQPTDAEVWELAARDGFTIVTKDADFFDKLLLQGSPPKVIWIRTGNLRLHELCELFRNCWPRIESMLKGSDLVEVFQERLEGLAFPPSNEPLVSPKRS